MKKAEIIARYGEEEYKRRLEQDRARYKAHKEEIRKEKKAASQKRRDAHPEQVKANNHERCRKGGKYYEKHLEYEHKGLRGERNKIRMKHGNQYRPYKQIIAPDSQLHHEWIPRTAEYRGLALVETNPHQYGIVDVIVILDGTITLLTEEEVKKGKKNE